MEKSLSPGETVIIVIATGSIIFFCLSVFIGIILLAYQRRQLQNWQERENLKAQNEKEVMQTQLEVQNSTLQQISQELHDNIGQLLSVAKINLNVLEEINPHPESLAYIKQTSEIIGRSIIDLRELSKSFDGDFVKDFGLESSLANELLRLKRTGKYETVLDVSGERYPLGHRRDIIIFRITQELFNNIMKHADANQINVALYYEPDSFTLSVLDNGRGFDLISLQNLDISHSGAGLRNIRKRAEMIGGKCDIQTENQMGTQIKILVPIGEN